MSSGLVNKSKSSVDDMSTSSPPAAPPSPAVASFAVFSLPSASAFEPPAAEAAEGGSFESPSFPFAAFPAAAEGSIAAGEATAAGAGSAACAGGLASAGCCAAAGAGLAGARAVAAGAAPATATRPRRHPLLGMCGPNTYKLSRSAGMSSPGGSTYNAKLPSRRTMPARIFVRKYFTYSSNAKCSCGACAVIDTTVPLATRRQASSKGTRWVMSNTFWLPAAERKHTSTSCTLPCNSDARVDNRFALFLARVKIPVHGATPAGGGATAAPPPAAGAVATAPPSPARPGAGADAAPAWLSSEAMEPPPA
mmetsp:Transcript_25230/g.71961  ORF Transcript_25230/g.71961 Transcript_25230/m.71961 type:complete len:308 (+) Transcript_25230:139-1062(+)